MKKKFTMLFAALLAFAGVAKAEVNPELQNKTIEIGAAATTVTPGWYILNNVGRSNIVSEETNAMKMRATNSVNNLDIASDKAGYLFKITEAGDGKYNIVSGNGLYFSLGWNSSAISNNPIAYEIDLIGNSTDMFSLYDLDNKRAADGQETGRDFVGWSDTKPANAGGNDSYRLLPVTLKEKATINVTYNYYLKGELKTQKTVNDVIVGSAFNAPAIDYVTFAYPEGNITAETTSVDVTCTENLPFEASANFESAKWYIVDMHWNDNGTSEILNGTKRYVWTYNSEGKDSNVELPKEFSKQTTLFGEDKMWCFIGNAFDGFKIYNKAAGKELTLNKAQDGNNVAGMSAEDATLYTLVAGVNNGTCFLPKGHTYYLNTQAVNGVKILKGWTDPDGGSSCRFFVPTHFVSDLLDEYLMPAGAVGALTALTEDISSAINTAYAAVKADGWNTAAITEEVTTALETLQEASEVITFAPGYYFIKGTGDEHGNPLYTSYNEAWYATHYINNGVNSMKAVELAENQKPSADHVWNFEAVEGEDNTYKLQQANLGTYAKLIAAGGTSIVDQDQANGDKFLFTAEAGSQSKFIIKNSDNKVMRTEGDGRINYWSGGEDAETWYLIRVTELEISINEFASICMPFDVKVEGATAYAVTETATESVTLTEKADIPAGEGAILEGNGTAKLVLATATSDWSDNLLLGTTVATEVEGKSYILANGANGIGLYNVTLTDGKFTNKANKAYLPASAVTNASAAMFVFSRGGEDEDTTGIDQLINNGEVVIYDLAGRRVEKMEKGIYIVNGKKVVK